MELTPIFGLKKPTSFDNADLRIFVGDNMNLIETALNARITGTDADASYSPINHAHGWTEITGKPTTFVPVLASSTNVGGARVGNGLGMSGEYLYIKTGNGLLIDANYSLALDKTYLDGLYSPIGHSHAIGDITGLRAELDSKIGSGTPLTDGLFFDFKTATATSAIIIEALDRDVNVFRVGNDQDEYGYDLQYLGSGTGNDNILRLRSHNLTAPTLPSEINIVDFHQDGTTKFHEQVILSNDASHLLFRDTTDLKEWHIEARSTTFRIVETGVIERFSLSPTTLTLSSKASSHLWLRADDDNLDENDTAMIIMSQDGGTTRFEIGLDTANFAYVRPYQYFNDATKQIVENLYWRNSSGTNYNFHHDGRTESIKAPSFVNGWGNYFSDAFRNGCYWKSQDGIVTLEGLLAGGTTGANCFVLPAGYRPSNTLIFTSYSYLGACRIDVRADGGVYMNSNTHATYTSISGITFKAEL